MLQTLDITDFGLIKGAVLEFERGFNVITGETGAGKSLIIEALNMVSGGRASVDFIRSGSGKARIDAVFNIENNGRIIKLLGDWGLYNESDSILIMSRELSRNGRNTCRLNGQMVTLGMYRETGRALLELHRQNEQQDLLNPANHLDQLDRYGGRDTLSLRKNVMDKYNNWLAAKNRLDDLIGNARDRTRRIDMLRYQIDEIDAAALEPGEEDKLLVEKNRLANAEKIKLMAGECYANLQGGIQDTDPVTVKLARSQKLLHHLSDLDPDYKTLRDTLDNIIYEAEDLVRELGDKRRLIEDDPQRQLFVMDRLEHIKTLKRKYGESIEEIITYGDNARMEMERLTTSEEQLDSFLIRVRELKDEFVKEAHRLSLQRRSFARRLEEEIIRELAEIGMPATEFKIVFKELPEPGPRGNENVEFMISPNPGEPLRALTKIASGGELSRFMLAFRSILSDVDDVATIILDEIDTGIGGRTIQSVAEKIAGVSRRHQVICVTHAPQLASHARTHFLITKETRNNKTLTRINLLSGEKRVSELARMLGGDNGTDLVREHARELLSNSIG